MFDSFKHWQNSINQNEMAASFDTHLNVLKDACGIYSLCWRHWKPSAVLCTLVGLLSRWHILFFYSKFVMFNSNNNMDYFINYLRKSIPFDRIFLEFIFFPCRQISLRYLKMITILILWPDSYCLFKLKHRCTSNLEVQIL